MAEISRRHAAPQMLTSDLARWRGYLWSTTKARKATTCWITGREIAAGSECFRPITNTYDRFRRVSVDAMRSEAAKL